MSNELIPADVMKDIVQLPGDDVFETLSSASQYLPYVTLGGGNTQVVKSGQLPMGTYGLMVGDNVIPLGPEMDVLVVSWIPKAMDTNGDTPVVVTNHTDPEFKRIMAASGTQDSGCMYGPEFLLYIPKVQKFATYFMASKTARKEAPNLKALVGKAATLKIKFIDPPKSKFSWHGPVVTNCSAPFDVPATDAIKEALSKFNAAPTVEKVSEDTGRAR